MTETRSDDVSIPALLRAARGCYAQAIAARLAAAGIEDLPRSGAFVVGGLALRGRGAVDHLRGLGVSKQAVSQLIDTLVLRGYLDREVDPSDRRRMTIELTDRGRAVADEIGEAVGRVEAELASMITPDELAGLRAGLAALARIKERSAPAGPP
ncbi:MAG: MarR family winged helix-turn-helix transcriptional regulator [Acidimicrobiales bacterium]